MKIDYKTTHFSRASFWSKPRIVLISLAILSSSFLAYIGWHALRPSILLTEQPIERVSLPATIQATLPIALPPPDITLKEAEPETLTQEISWQTIQIQPGDNLAKIFSRLGLSAIDVHRVIHAGAEAKALRKLLPGRELRIQLDQEGQLLGLRYPVAKTEVLTILPGDKPNAWKSHIEALPVKTVLAHGSATIQDSLFLAGKRAGLSDALVMELAELFGWDIDFVFDIRPGDTFRVVHEAYVLEDKKVADGPILAADFQVGKQHYQVFRYTNSQGETDYYTPEGNSIRRAFLRTPVNFTRISSKFNLNRKHPVLHKIRAHRGVDYAAPHGTPVKATGDGKVIFAGTHGGYGEIIKIQHGSHYTTFYAHLSRFAKGIRSGRHVQQGQVIGYVGSSGLATGPHLHYEFQIKGVHKNPLTVALPQASKIPATERVAFEQRLSTLKELIESPQGIMLATYAP